MRPKNNIQFWKRIKKCPGHAKEKCKVPTLDFFEHFYTLQGSYLGFFPGRVLDKDTSWTLFYPQPSVLFCTYLYKKN